MAISVVASVNGTDGSVVGTTGVTVTHGLTLADNDVLYAFCGVGTADLGSAPSLISAFACSGWTELSGSFVQNSGGNDRAGSVLRKVITTASGEPSSYTFTATGAADTTAFVVTIVQLRGVDTTTPEDVALPTPSTITNDFTPASPAITTTTDGALNLAGHLASFGAAEVSTGITFGAPSGYTLLGSGAVASNGTSSPRDVSLAVAYKTVTTAATETPGSFTHSPDDATREGITWSVAVRPGAVTGLSDPMGAFGFFGV